MNNVPGRHRLVACNVENESRVCSLVTWENASGWPRPNDESCSHDCAPRSCAQATPAVLVWS